MKAQMDEFLELLTPLKKDLMGYIRYLLWNKNDLEDGLRNTLTEAYRRFNQFEKGTNYKSWIFQVASFTIFNMNRRYEKEMARERTLTDANEPTAYESLQGNEDYQKLLQNDMSFLEKVTDKVKTSLNLLNQKERSVFLLHALGELSYAEIAQTLQIPMGSVMAYLSRARSKLRNQLTHYAKEGGYL